MLCALQGVYDPTVVALTSAFFIGFAGIPGLFISKPGFGQLLATVITIAASLSGFAAALVLLFSQNTTTFAVNWGLPFGPCEISIDPLSAFFLIPVYLVAASGSLFALGYWPAREHPSTEKSLTFFYGILAASMAVLLTARNGVFFLMFWEVMAISAYFLVVTEQSREDVRKAGTVYLIATHTGSAALYALFSLLSAESGSLTFPVAGSLLPYTPAATAILLTAFVGFGAKAGIMPLHTWLPQAHANAPSHVSAIMSGVMLKMGLYGIFRTLTFFHDPPIIWGVVLTVAGILSALFGILFALAQKDLKRLLACSSIENIGIITTSLGVAMLGISSNNRTLAYLGMAGALLHILNHSFFKPLLFFGSGVIIHATGSRDMNLMGGLAKNMPRAALLFLIGSVSICGIPPLNGFVSEFLIYSGFFSQIQASTLVYLVLLAPLLALVGGMALIAFTKLYSSIFLGTPRSYFSTAVHEPGFTMLLPMAFFALLCVLIGLLPYQALRFVNPAINVFMPGTAIPFNPDGYGDVLGKISLTGLSLVALAAVVTLFWRWRMQRAGSTTGSTWGCGYQRGSSRMQYGATSFSELPVSVFNGIVRQDIKRPVLSGLFPGKSLCSDAPTETFLERVIAPLFSLAGVSFAFLRRLQHGRMHVYMIYIFATLFILMLWAH
ncbi:MAG: proton-conducting transporter membrane subunit [Desulfuromonadaceae bacterium]|nr:proton-conducting transporter membrane subunit [Desulfuromonadaceae bacterium]MDD2854679.1 proton-conducting transporter membrane subunit [Desulfuromonadaceae bacterium]